MRTKFTVTLDESRVRRTNSSCSLYPSFDAQMLTPTSWPNTSPAAPTHMVKAPLSSVDVLPAASPQPKANHPLLDTPSVQRATAGLQHQLGSFVLSIDGVWGRGHSLLETFDANAPDASGRRPDPQYQIVRVIESRGHSSYRGIEAGLTKSYTGGYSLSTAYTLSSAQRDTEDFDFVPQDSRHPEAERGPATSDVRHQLVGSGSADLPFGLQLGLVISIRSSPPYNITTGKDDNLDGTINDRPPGVGRNSARGSGFFELDARVVKMIGFGGARFELSAESFNLTNHANWSAYDGQQNSVTYLRPTAAGIARQVQLGANFKF